VREIEVIADPARLAGRGPDVRRPRHGDPAVGGSGCRGPRDAGLRQYLVVMDQEARTPEEIGEVALADGLRVKDVASVQVGTQDGYA